MGGSQYQARSSEAQPLILLEKKTLQKSIEIGSAV